jgi:hypothetical protein
MPFRPIRAFLLLPGPQSPALEMFRASQKRPPSRVVWRQIGLARPGLAQDQQSVRCEKVLSPP